MANISTRDTSFGGRAGGMTLTQRLAFLAGAVFLLVGIGGFIPGITSDYDNMSFAGHEGAKLLGIFQVNIVHNVAHLLFGIGILAAARYDTSRTFLLAGGVAYLGLTLFGFVVDHDANANFLAINDADNWLHLGLGLGLLALGIGAPAGDEHANGR